MNGSNSYAIHVPANKLPETVIDTFWSVILVGVPDYRVVPNALNRFNFNNYSPLQKEPDGSLKITLGPTLVAGVKRAPRGSFLKRSLVAREEVTGYALLYRVRIYKGDLSGNAEGSRIGFPATRTENKMNVLIFVLESAPARYFGSVFR